MLRVHMKKEPYIKGNIPLVSAWPGSQRPRPAWGLARPRRDRPAHGHVIYIYMYIYYREKENINYYIHIFCSTYSHTDNCNMDICPAWAYLCNFCKSYVLHIYIFYRHVIIDTCMRCGACARGGWAVAYPGELEAGRAINN